jgi:hypothetical protein
MQQRPDDQRDQSSAIEQEGKDRPVPAFGLDPVTGLQQGIFKHRLTPIYPTYSYLDTSQGYLLLFGFCPPEE